MWCLLFIRSFLFFCVCVCLHSFGFEKTATKNKKTAALFNWDRHIILIVWKIPHQSFHYYTSMNDTLSPNETVDSILSSRERDSFSFKEEEPLSALGVTLSSSSHVRKDVSCLPIAPPLSSPPLPPRPKAFISDRDFEHCAPFQDVYVFPALPSIASIVPSSYLLESSSIPLTTTSSAREVRPKRRHSSRQEGAEGDPSSSRTGISSRVHEDDEPATPLANNKRTKRNVKNDITLQNGPSSAAALSCRPTLEKTKDWTSRKTAFPRATLVSPFWQDEQEAGEKGRTGTGSTKRTASTSSHGLRYTLSPACLGWRCPSCGEVEMEKIFWQDEIEAARGRKQELYHLYYRIATLRKRAVEYKTGTKGGVGGDVDTNLSSRLPPRPAISSASPFPSSSLSRLSSSITRWHFLVRHVAMNPTLSRLLFRPPPPRSAAQTSRKRIKERAQVVSRVCGNCFLCPRCSGIPTTVSSDGFRVVPAPLSSFSSFLGDTTSTITSRYSLCGLRLRLAPHTGQLYAICPHCEWCSLSGEEESRRRIAEATSVKERPREGEGKKEKKNKKCPSQQHKSADPSPNRSPSPAASSSCPPPVNSSPASSLSTAVAGNEEQMSFWKEGQEERSPPADTGFLTLDSLQLHCQKWSNQARLQRCFPWWKGRVALYQILGSFLHHERRVPGASRTDPKPATATPSPSSSLRWSYAWEDEVEQCLVWKRLQWGSPMDYPYRPLIVDAQRQMLRQGSGGRGWDGSEGGQSGAPWFVSSTPYMTRTPIFTASRHVWERFLLLGTLARQLHRAGAAEEPKWLVDPGKLWSETKEVSKTTADFPLLEGTQSSPLPSEMALSTPAAGSSAVTETHHEVPEAGSREKIPLQEAQGHMEVLQWVKVLERYHPAVVMDNMHEALRRRDTTRLRLAIPWVSGAETGPIPSEKLPSSHQKSHTKEPSLWSQDALPSSSSLFTATTVHQLSHELGSPPLLLMEKKSPCLPSAAVFRAAPFCTAIKAKEYYEQLCKEAKQRFLLRRKEKEKKTKAEDPSATVVSHGTKAEEATPAVPLEDILPGVSPCAVPRVATSAQYQNMVEAELYIASQALYVGAPPSTTVPGWTSSSPFLSTSIPGQQVSHQPLAEWSHGSQGVGKHSSETHSVSTFSSLVTPTCTLLGEQTSCSLPSPGDSSTLFSPFYVRYGLQAAPKQSITAMVCRIQVPSYLLLHEILQRVVKQYPDPTPAETETEKEAMRKRKKHPKQEANDVRDRDRKTRRSRGRKTMPPFTPHTFETSSDPKEEESTRNPSRTSSTRKKGSFELGFPSSSLSPSFAASSLHFPVDVLPTFTAARERRTSTERAENAKNTEKQNGKRQPQPWWDGWEVFPNGRPRVHRSRASQFLLLLDGQQDEEITPIVQYWKDAYAHEEEATEEEETSNKTAENGLRPPSALDALHKREKDKEELLSASFDSSSLMLSLSSPTATESLRESGEEKETKETTTVTPHSQEETRKRRERGSSSLQWLLSGGRVTAAALLPFIEAQWERPPFSSSSDFRSPCFPSPPSRASSTSMEHSSRSFLSSHREGTHIPSVALQEKGIEEEVPAPVLRITCCNLSGEDCVVSSIALAHLGPSIPFSTEETLCCATDNEEGDATWKLHGEDVLSEQLLPTSSPSLAMDDDGGLSSSRNVVLLPRGGYDEGSTCATALPEEETEEQENDRLAECLSWTLRPHQMRRSTTSAMTSSPPTAVKEALERSEEEKGNEAESTTSGRLASTSSHPPARRSSPALTSRGGHPSWIGLTVKVRIALPIELLRSLRILFSSLFALPSSSFPLPRFPRTVSTVSSSPPDKEEAEDENEDEDVLGQTVSGGCLFPSSPLKGSSCFYASSSPQVWHEVEYGIILVL